MSAHRAVTDLGGAISHTEALGVSHLVVEFPAAPEGIRAQRPKERSAQALPKVSPTERTPVRAGSSTPAKPLRFD